MFIGQCSRTFGWKIMINITVHNKFIWLDIFIANQSLYFTNQDRPNKALIFNNSADFRKRFFLIFLSRSRWRLEKLFRKSLFVKVQKINGNLKRLSRKILFPLGELPFILIYQTMSSIYVSLMVNICFCRSFTISQFAFAHFLWFDSDGASSSTENDMITIFVP